MRNRHVLGGDGEDIQAFWSRYHPPVSSQSLKGAEMGWGDGSVFKAWQKDLSLILRAHIKSVKRADEMAQSIKHLHPLSPHRSGESITHICGPSTPMGR